LLEKVLVTGARRWLLARGAAKRKRMTGVLSAKYARYGSRAIPTEGEKKKEGDRTLVGVLGGEARISRGNGGGEKRRLQIVVIPRGRTTVSYGEREGKTAIADGEDHSNIVR